MPYIGYDEAFRVPAPGERVPMTQFPPLYPALVALVHGPFGMGLLSGARAIGAIAFLITAAGSAALVIRASGPFASAAAAAGLLMAPDLVTIHAMAWSEPVMLAGVVGSLWCLWVYTQDRRRGALVGAAAFGVVASMARFAGYSAIVAAALVLLFERRDPPARRALRAGIFFLIGSAPTVVWFARNAVVAGRASEKTLSWHPPGIRHLAQAAETVGGWVVPGRTAAIVCGALLAAGAIVALIRRGLRGVDTTSLPGLCVVIGVIYSAFVLATRTLLDQNIALDTRILAPLQLLAVVAVCSALPREPSRRVRWMTVAIAVVATVSLVRGVVTAIGFSESSVAGYTSERWRESETLAYAGSLPDDTVILTNAPDPIWLWHGRSPLLLPPLSNLYAGGANERFPAQVEALRDATACRNAVLVFFDQPTRKPVRTIPPEIVAGLRLRAVARFEDGEAHDVAGPGPGC